MKLKAIVPWQTGLFSHWLFTQIMPPYPGLGAYPVSQVTVNASPVVPPFSGENSFAFGIECLPLHVFAEKKKMTQNIKGLHWHSYFLA